MIKVDGQEYKESIFLIQAQAAYAKAVAFRAEATVAIATRTEIWAAVAGYYSLFHLSIALMFILPEFVDPPLLRKLVEGRGRGARDPTDRIKHAALPRFLESCEQNGLPPNLRALLGELKRLREFANYEPRVVWRDDTPTFLTRKHSPDEVRQAVGRSAALFAEVIRWAHDQPFSDNWRAAVPILLLDDFFTKQDLFFTQWCRPEVIHEARRFTSELPFFPRRTDN